MKKVLDIDGSVVRGATKTNTGSIQLNDTAAYKIYQKKKEAATRNLSEIEDLKEQVAFLKSALTDLLKKEKNG